MTKEDLITLYEVNPKLTFQELALLTGYTIEEVQRIIALHEYKRG